MKKSKQHLKTVLAISAIAFLTACGTSKNQGSMDFSSRTPFTTTPTSSSSKAFALCSRGNGTEINTKVKVFVDSSNTTKMDFVYVRLTSLPTNFKENKNYISMWKWLASSSGSTYLDPAALEFILTDASTNQMLTEWKKTLYWSDVVTIASGMGINDVQSFFDRVNILVDLKDAKGEYDVLKITNYDSSTNKPVSQTDALLPLFSVNPADYAFEPNGSARAQVLQALHPFQSQASQGFTTEKFASMANDFCF